MKHSVCMFAIAVSASALFFGCSDAKDAVEAVKDTAAAAAEKTGEVAAAAVDKAGDAVGAVKDVAVAAAEKTGDVAAAAADKAGDAVGAVKDVAAAAAEKTAEVAAAAADKAGDAVGAVKDVAAAAADKAGDAVGAVKDVAAAAVEKAGDAAGAAKDAGVAVIGKVATAVAGAAAVVAPKEGTIRMITEATFPPYEFRQGQEIVGIDVEICKAIAKALGKELKVEDVEFQSVIPSLTAGKAELAAAGITINEDRKKQVDFSVPYVRTGIVFVYAKDKPFSEKKPEEAKGKRIGVQDGTTSADYVRKELGQEPDMFDSPASAFAALKAGKVDVVIADIDPAKAVIKGQEGYDISDLLTVEEYAVAIKKGQPELLATINKVIEGLKDSGELDKITDEMTAKANAMQAAEEAKPAEAPKAVEEAKPAEAAKAAEEAKPAEAPKAE